MAKDLGPSLGKRWVVFSRKSAGLLTLRASVLATIIALDIWWVELNTIAVWRVSAIVLELCAALAIGYGLPAIANRRHWRAHVLLLWAAAEQFRLYPPTAARDLDGVDSRVDELLAAGTGAPASWVEARALAVELRPSARREQVLALADLCENGWFESPRFRAAIAELGDDAERRYWRVRFAMTEAFAAFLNGDDYVTPLLVASAEEGPFLATAKDRWRVYMARFGFSALILAVGVATALLLAIVGA
jgi:hypothetical protein